MTVKDFLLNSFDFDSFGTKDIYFMIGSTCYNFIANKKNRSEDFNVNQMNFLIKTKGDCVIKSWKIIPETTANGMYNGLQIKIDVE